MFNYYVIGAADTFPISPAIERFAHETNVVAVDGSASWTEEPHARLDRLDQTAFRSAKKVNAIVGSGETGEFFDNRAYSFISSTRAFAADFMDWTYLRPGLPLQMKQLQRGNQKTSRDTVTLESLVEDSECGPPDLLYIDVEGSEFDVLSAAVDTLKNSVLRIDLEAQMVPMFEGQHLFDDILKLMRSCGFMMTQSSFGNWTPFKRRSNLPTKGFAVSGHVEFVKDPRLVADMKDPLRAALKAAVFHVGQGDLLYANHMLTVVVPDLIERGHDRLPRQMPDYVKFALAIAQLLSEGEAGFQMPGRGSKQTAAAWHAKHHAIIERVRSTEETRLESFLRESGFHQTADTAKAFRQQSVELADKQKE